MLFKKIKEINNTCFASRGNNMLFKNTKHIINILSKTTKNLIANHLKTSKMAARAANMLKWLVLMLESILHITIPFGTILPYSTRYLMDYELLKTIKLRKRERAEIAKHVVCSGWMSMLAFFGLFLGFFGRWGPFDVFDSNGNNPLNVIINRRKKNSCCICLSKFKLDCSVRVLKCGHCFHEACFSRWQKSCPLCRS